MAWAPQLQGSTCPHLRAMRASVDGQSELRFLVYQHHMSSQVSNRMVQLAHRLDSPLASDGRKDKRYGFCCSAKSRNSEASSPRSVAAGGGIDASVFDEDLHVCLHCSFVGTRQAVHGRPLQRHLIATGHIYAVRVATSESNQACVWCSRCGDYVYDTAFATGGDDGVGGYTLATNGRSSATVAAQRLHSRSLVPYHANSMEGSAAREDASFLEPRQWAALMQAGLVPALRPTGVAPPPSPTTAVQLSASMRASVGLRGLYNMGNTCFMSCVLQGLVQCPLLQGLLRSPRVRKLHRADRCPVARRSGLTSHADASPCLACALVSFYDAMFTPPPLQFALPPQPQISAVSEQEAGVEGAELKASDISKGEKGSQKLDKEKPCPPIAPHALLHALWCRASRLASYAQHDAHEFLVALLEVVGEDLKTAEALSYGPPTAREISSAPVAAPPPPPTSAPVGAAAVTSSSAAPPPAPAPAPATAARAAEDLPNPLDQAFTGELCSTVTCGHCGNSSQKREPFVDLSLPLPGDGFAGSGGGGRSGGGSKSSKSSGRGRARDYDGNGSGYHHEPEDPSMERVPLWNRTKRVCVRGMSAPRRGRLDEYLQTHPHCEVYVNQDGKQTVSLNTKAGGQQGNTATGSGGATNSSGPGNTGTGRDKNKKRALLRERKKRLQAEAQAAAAAAAGCSGTCNTPSGAKSLRAFVSEGPVACDSCGESFNEGSSFFGCRICNYDLCLGCHTKAVAAIDDKAADAKDNETKGAGPSETSMDRPADDTAMTKDQMEIDDSGMRKDDANNIEDGNDNHEVEGMERAENDGDAGMKNTEVNNTSVTSVDRGDESGSVDGMQEMRIEDERNDSFDDDYNDEEMKNGHDATNDGLQNINVLHESGNKNALNGGTEVIDGATAPSTHAAGAATVTDAASAHAQTSVTSLQACLAQFTAPEYLNESSGFWCEACNCRRSASKQLTLSRLPNALVIHLKRFDGASDLKRDDPVTFPTLSLDLAPFTTAPLCSPSSKEEDSQLPDNLPENQLLNSTSASVADTTKSILEPSKSARNQAVEAVVSEPDASSLRQSSSSTSASSPAVPVPVEDNTTLRNGEFIGGIAKTDTAGTDPTTEAGLGAVGAPPPPPPQLQRKLTAREEFAAMAEAGKAAAASAVASRSAARRGSVGNSSASSNSSGSFHGDDPLTGEAAFAAAAPAGIVSQEVQEDDSAASQAINLLANSGTARGLPSSSCELLYDLSAVVHHTGNLGKGHYTATVASPLGGWWACDDASVEPILVEAPAAAATAAAAIVHSAAAPPKVNADITPATNGAQSSSGGDAGVASVAVASAAVTDTTEPAPAQPNHKGASGVANGPYVVPGEKASGSAYILFYTRRKYSTQGALNTSTSPMVPTNSD